MASRLRLARDALGLTSADMARRLDRPEPSFSRWANGGNWIPRVIIHDLDRLFGITASYLFSGRTGDLPKSLADRLP
jgi:transcriptional regulator with XRE-family HTH domain